jgi:anti-anti-sigma regulatory factor
VNSLLKEEEVINSIVLDLNGVYMGDSSAARTLAKIYKKMEEKEIKFRTVNCNVSTIFIRYPKMLFNSGDP